MVVVAVAVAVTVRGAVAEAIRPLWSEVNGPLLLTYIYYVYCKYNSSLYIYIWLVIAYQKKYG